MGVDMWMRVAKLNTETGKYDPVWLYTKDADGNFQKVNVYNGRDYDLFDILQDQDGKGFPCHKVYTSLLSDELATEVQEYRNELGTYGFYEVNLADMQTYALRHPDIPDYESDDDEIKLRPTPIQKLIDNVLHYVELYDWLSFWDNEYSEIKLIYWFGH